MESRVGGEVFNSGLLSGFDSGFLFSHSQPYVVHPAALAPYSLHMWSMLGLPLSALSLLSSLGFPDRLEVVPGSEGLVPVISLTPCCQYSQPASLLYLCLFHRMTLPLTPQRIQGPSGTNILLPPCSPNQLEPFMPLSLWPQRSALWTPLPWSPPNQEPVSSSGSHP